MIPFEYLVQLKKVKGVLFASGVESERMRIDFLGSCFHDDFLAIPASMWRLIPKSNSLRHIDLPFGESEHILEKITSMANCDFSVIESMAMASALICPLIILNRNEFGRFKPLVLTTFRGDPIRKKYELKKHVNLLELTAIHYFTKSMNDAEKVFNGDLLLERVLRSRRISVLNEAKKRFWRLGDGSNGKIIFAYLDILQYAAKTDIDKGELKNFPFWSVVPAIILDNIF